MPHSHFLVPCWRVLPLDLTPVPSPGCQVPGHRDLLCPALLPSDGNSLQSWPARLFCLPETSSRWLGALVFLVVSRLAGQGSKLPRSSLTSHLLHLSHPGQAFGPTSRSLPLQSVLNTGHLPAFNIYRHLYEHFHVLAFRHSQTVAQNREHVCL